MRAIAVVPVVFFHADFSGFEGGFVGVDIFFVISGFLITSILANDLERGQFSLLDFYERRARRILPAFFIVIVACLPTAWLWFTPRDLIAYSHSVIAAVTFWSNIHFLGESGYFATAGEFKPLLHTWSLSVEEQFYVFFPLMLLAAWRFGTRIVMVLLSIVLLASLVWAEWSVKTDPTSAYYLLSSRAWELMIGAVAAIAVTKGWIELTKVTGEMIGFFGFAMIIYSVATFDNGTQIPGLPALVPTLGALFVILPVRERTLVHRLLSLPAFVGIGLLSYAGYLWHFPLFAFARYLSFDEPSIAMMGTLSLMSFVLAYLSWRFVEAPFRSRKRFSRGKIFATGAAFAVSLLSVAGLMITFDGVPSRLKMPQSVEASMVRSDRQEECFDKKNWHEIQEWTCVLGDAEKPPVFLAFGDSHALSMLDVLDAAATETGVSGEFAGISGCAPFLGIHALRQDQEEKNCHAGNTRLLQYASDLGVKSVVLIARWTYYTDGGHNGDHFSYIARDANAPKHREDSRAAFEWGLSNTVQIYQEAGIELTIIAQVPEQLADPIRLYRRGSLPSFDIGKVISDMSVSLEQHRELQRFVTEVFARHGARVLDMTDLLCSGDVCAFGTPNISYYYDNDHLSVAGANRLLSAFKDLVGQRSE